MRSWRHIQDWRQGSIYFQVLRSFAYQGHCTLPCECLGYNRHYTTFRPWDIFRRMRRLSLVRVFYQNHSNDKTGQCSHPASCSWRFLPSDADIPDFAIRLVCAAAILLPHLRPTHLPNDIASQYPANWKVLCETRSIHHSLAHLLLQLNPPRILFDWADYHIAFLSNPQDLPVHFSPIHSNHLCLGHSRQNLSRRLAPCSDVAVHTARLRILAFAFFYFGAIGVALLEPYLLLVVRAIHIL